MAADWSQTFSLTAKQRASENTGGEKRTREGILIHV